MLYIHEIYSRRFKAEGSKEAYLKACKFVASTVLSEKSKVEASKIVWDVTKVEEEEDSLPTFLLTLYFKFDDTKFKDQTCQACKEFHKSFYINTDFNCSRCNKIGYEKNVQSKLMTGSQYIKKMIDDELDRL